MYDIEYTPEAIDDLKLFRKYEQQAIVDQIDEQLLYEPIIETRNRKKLRPNNVAEYELRTGKFRIFYDVNEAVKIVKVEAIGYKESGRLFIHGQEYKL